MFKLKGNLCRGNYGKQIKNVIFCVCRLTYTFMGKWVDKNTVSDTKPLLSEYLGLTFLACIPPRLGLSFNILPVSLISLWPLILSQCLYHGSKFATGLQIETLQSWRWSMKVAKSRIGLHFVLYFLRQFSLLDPFFFRYSKGLAFTYYEKIL